MKFETVEELKENVNLVDYIEKCGIELHFSGGEYKGLCPFHQEKTPSFSVNPNKNIWYCFGCGKGTDIFDFVQGMYKLSFKDAVKKVCEDCGAELKETPSIIHQLRKYRSGEKEEQLRPHTYLLENVMEEFPKNHKIIEWLEEGVSESVLESHDVRYDNLREKIIFPIFDEKKDRKIIALKTRTLLPDYKERKIPKYTLLGKMGRKDFLYWWQPNLENIKKKSECIIVEGEKSQMLLESWGYNNVVAVGSHFISDEHEKMLAFCGCRRVIFAYDKDVDKKEILRQTTFLRHFVNCYVVYDRNDILEEKDSPLDKGKKVWENLYEETVPLK